MKLRQACIYRDGGSLSVTFQDISALSMCPMEIKLEVKWMGPGPQKYGRLLLTPQTENRSPFVILKDSDAEKNIMSVIDSLVKDEFPGGWDEAKKLIEEWPHRPFVPEAGPGSYENYILARMKLEIPRREP